MRSLGTPRERPWPRNAGAVGVFAIIAGLVIIGAEGVVRFGSGHAPLWMTTSYGIIATLVGLVFAVAGLFAIRR